MSLLMRIILGIVITLIGAAMVYRTDLMLNWFGYSSWAESKLGGGGSRLMYKVIGVLACFVGIMFATDLFDRIIGSFIASLFT